MTDPTTKISDQEIRDWLLRRTDAQRCAVIEQQLFVDAGLADRVDAVACDLIDDYAHGRLPATEARVVQGFDAWRIRFARAFVKLPRPAVPLAPPQTRTSPLRRVGLGAALAASLIFGVMFFGWRTVGTDHPASADALPVVTLLLEQQRGAAAPLNLPRHDGKVRIQAEMPASSTVTTSRYALSVADGSQLLFVVHDLAPRNAGPYRYVEAVIPMSVLGAGVRRVDVAEEGTRDVTEASWSVQVATSR